MLLSVFSLHYFYSLAYDFVIFRYLKIHKITSTIYTRKLADVIALTIFFSIFLIFILHPTTYRHWNSTLASNSFDSKFIDSPHWTIVFDNTFILFWACLQVKTKLILQFLVSLE